MASTTTDGSRHFPPLRGTCNRCRELKVRCRSDITNGSDWHDSSCVRCLRAGAICTYSPKRRSGRPPGTPTVQSRSAELGPPESLGAVPSPSAPSSSASASSAMTSPGGMGHGALDTVAWSVLPRPQQFFLSESPSDINSLDFGSADIDLMELLDEDQDTGPGFPSPLESDYRVGIVPRSALDNTHNSPSEPTIALSSGGLSNGDSQGRPGRASEYHKQRGRQINATAELAHFDIETDTLAKQITALGALNLQIYYLLGQLKAEGKLLTHCDAITRLARSFLDILNGFPSGSAVHGAGANDIDCSTLLLAMSCYQRLVEVFKHICCSVHSNYEQGSATDTPSGSYQSGTAQAVMATELISHLLQRLDRGLHRLTQPDLSPAPSGPQADSAPSTGCCTTAPCSSYHCRPEERHCGVHHPAPRSGCHSHGPMNSAIGVSCAAAEKPGHHFVQHTEQGAHDPGTRFQADATTRSNSSQAFIYQVVNRAIKENEELRSKITLIKRLIQESDGV